MPRDGQQLRLIPSPLLVGFSVLQPQMIDRGLFTSAADLRRKILCYIGLYAKTASALTLEMHQFPSLYPGTIEMPCGQRKEGSAAPGVAKPPVSQAMLNRRIPRARRVPLYRMIAGWVPLVPIDAATRRQTGART